MFRVLFIPSVEVAPTTSFAQTLLDGVSAYGTDFLDWGRRYKEVYAVSSEPDSGNYPASTDVRDGISYGNGSYEGDLVLPTEEQVIDGVGFGANAAEYEGKVILPAESDVRDGVGYGVDYGPSGTEYEGTFVGGGANVHGSAW